ncbi:MAG: hypothetical protein RR851_14605 [Clostridium sp.]
MKSVSAAYKVAIKKPSRTISCRFVISSAIGNIQITDTELVSVDIDNSILNSEKFELGGGIASTCNITINNYSNKYTEKTFINKWIKLYFAIELEDKTKEELFYNEYLIEDASETGKTIKLDCFDRLVMLDDKYKSKANFPVLVSYIVEDMAASLKLSLGDNLKNKLYLNNDLMIQSKPVDLTYRQVLTDVATIAGGFLVCKEGKIDVITFSDTDVVIDKSNAFKTTISADYKIIDTIDINGAIVGKKTGNRLEIDIALLDNNRESDLTKVGNSILNAYKTFTYTGFTTDWQGDIAIEICDRIKVHDDKEVVKTSFVSTNKIKYQGGLTATTEAKVDKETVKTSNREVQKIQSQIKEIESGIYYFTNTSNFTVNTIDKQLCYIEFATSSSANLLLFVSIQLEGTGTVECKILVDNTEALFKPKFSVTGNGLLSFSYPIIQSENGTSHGVGIMIKSDKDINIKTEQAQVTLFGQKLIGGLSDSRPHTEVIEEIPYMLIKGDGVTSSCVTMVQAPIPINITQNVNYTALDITKITTNLIVDIIHRGFVMLWEESLYLNNENYNFSSSLTHKVEEFSNAGTLCVNGVDHIVLECALPTKDTYYLIEEGELI